VFVPASGGRVMPKGIEPGQTVRPDKGYTAVGFAPEPVRRLISDVLPHQGFAPKNPARAPVFTSVIRPIQRLVWRTPKSRFRLAYRVRTRDRLTGTRASELPDDQSQ